VEQRRLRLGDILDDYCPRERRVTNHAVVAMIEDDVKQTRCTTCDAEHAYKGGKAPRRRKKDAPALVGAADVPIAIGAITSDGDDDDIADVSVELDDEVDSDEFLEPEPALSADSGAASDDEPVSLPAIEDGPVHRPLLRAKLPRPEGQKIERQMPDFTIRHVAARGNGSFRGNGRPKMRALGAGNGNGNGNGNGTGGRPSGRFSGPRPGAPGRSGPPGGFRSGPPRHSGKKRSR
jgi:hypothetical protein